MILPAPAMNNHACLAVPWSVGKFDNLMSVVAAAKPYCLAVAGNEGDEHDGETDAEEIVR